MATAPHDPSDALAERFADFAARARDEASTLLDRAWRDALSLFADRPGMTPTVRAQCDAVELADLPWGVAGPRALTGLARRFGLLGHAEPRDVFYPYHW